MPPMPLHPRVASLLAVAAQLLGAGRPGDAIGPLREAAGWAPGNAAILHDLGLACLECGHIGEAVTSLQAAVAANPRFADAHLRLGIALEAAGARDAALAAYRRAWRAQPRLADAQYRAGDLLDSIGQTAQAMAAFCRAAAAAPKTTLGRIATARALLAENRDAEAEKILRLTLAQDNNNGVALDLLGTVLAESGRFDEARLVIARAIECAPLRAGSYYELVRCRRIRPEDGPLIGQMRAALAIPGLEPAQLSRVHLALGKAADDLGDPETAMRHCDAAEALRNTLSGFDLTAFEALVDRLIARITPAFFANTAPAVPCLAGPTPLLILGLPRSGTTLVEQILSAHPDVRAGGELPFWNERGAAWARSGAADPRAGADYLRLLHGIAHGAAYVTDKMPLNFQWAGLIHHACPAAILIHCRRSPIDTALSIHRTHFNPRMAFPTGGTALVGYMRAYQRLCAHWRDVLPAQRFIEVQYEALTATPAPVIARLVAACGLSWNDACLRPDRNARVIKTPSKWQARQPMSTASIGAWRAYAPWLGALRALLDEAAEGAVPDTVIAATNTDGELTETVPV